MRTRSVITVEVEVEYNGRILLDQRRLDWLQQYFRAQAKEAAATLCLLRFEGEAP